jgi:hypothetical protein
MAHVLPPQDADRAVERLLVRSRKDNQLYLINAITMHQGTLQPRKILWDASSLQGPLPEDLTRVLGIPLEDLGRHWGAVYDYLQGPIRAELIAADFDPVGVCTSEAI